jgi:hypothetical protein
VYLERTDLLRLIVLKNAKILLGQAFDRLTVGVGDYDVDHHGSRTVAGGG